MSSKREVIQAAVAVLGQHAITRNLASPFSPAEVKALCARPVNEMVAAYSKHYQAAVAKAIQENCLEDYIALELGRAQVQALKGGYPELAAEEVTDADIAAVAALARVLHRELA